MGQRPTAGRQAMASLMGLAIFGEKVAARAYVAMADLRVEHGDLLRRFAAMEARHGSSFLQVSRANAVEPDREFADRELGYLVEQVERHARASDFDALASQRTRDDRRQPRDDRRRTASLRRRLAPAAALHPTVSDPGRSRPAVRRS
jgi:hypothetical protein